MSKILAEILKVVISNLLTPLSFSMETGSSCLHIQVLPYSVSMVTSSSCQHNQFECSLQLLFLFSDTLQLVEVAFHTLFLTLYKDYPFLTV